MEEILVDELGYKQFFDELEKLKEKLASIASEGSDAYKDAIGDGWHDNFAFEEAKRNERDISAKINKMINERSKLKIVESKEGDNNIINIGDVIKLLIKYDVDDVEEYTLKVTGKYIPDSKDLVQEISLNSPLGKALYMQDINSDLSYEVNGRKIQIEVIEFFKSGNIVS